jgi:hypothetical protein
MDQLAKPEAAIVGLGLTQFDSIFSSSPFLGGEGFRLNLNLN